MTILSLESDPHNLAMLANVRPTAHGNPKPAEKYNLVVIGAGPAGLVAAAGAAALGAKVALVEKHGLGGDCLFAGCVPSKAIIQSARVAAATAEPLDFARVMERMRRLRAQISANDSVARFTSLGVDVFLGEGRFSGRNCVEVAGESLQFSRALIATGSSAVVPDIPGLAASGFDTNLSIFDLTERPESLIVLGGGPIGCELGQAFQCLGVKVTLLQSAARLMPRDDTGAAEIVRARMAANGVEIFLDAKVLKVEMSADGLRVATYEQMGKSKQVASQRILVATGRKPQLDSLNLNAAGVKFDTSGVVIDDFLRTSNPRIYAAGDVCSKFKFTHAADAMARIVLRNALFFGRARVSKLVVPWTTYTDPEVAQVGLTAEAANEAGIPTDVLTAKMRDVDRAILESRTEGFGRLVLKKGTGKILGATLVAPHAGDMIGELALAMTAGLDARALSTTIHPYPTLGEIWRKLGDQYNRSRLTPRTKSMLSALMAMRR